MSIQANKSFSHVDGRLKGFDDAYDRYYVRKT
jgi:hypothetical protein